MTLIEISDKIEAVGGETVIWKNKRVYIKSTPNGGKADYGYLEAGDAGTSGTCQNITKRKGEIAAILRS